jgi:D-alanyl-D-alanine carboxypeptidase/D-alanyl-D-alanine-endopeptidase (penicillin-binding protein 4)
VSPYQVTSNVRTVAAGGETDIQVSASPDGTRITLSGTIAEDAGPALRVSAIQDPTAFGRTALIEALARAGVAVTAPSTGPNRADTLPATYPADSQVAAYTSPPFSEYAKLILKVGHNLGANLTLCLMAVASGSTNCADGFPRLRSFLVQAGVDPTQVKLLDGRGGNPVDRTTPTALTQLLEYWLRTSDGDLFRESLPILGVDGTLAGSCTAYCSAQGQVFAKTGTVAGLDALNNRLAVGAGTVAGYLKTPGGELHPFFVGVNDASTPDVEGLLGIADDVARIAAILQEQATDSSYSSEDSGDSEGGDAYYYSSSRGMETGTPHKKGTGRTANRFPEPEREEHRPLNWWAVRPGENE